jgi:TP901 family phage tail tape measure protein
MTRVGLEFFGVDAGAKAQCQAAIDQLAELRTATAQQTAAAQESADVTVAGARAKVESLVQERATLRENLAAYQQLAAAATAGSEEQIAATKLATDAQAKLGVTTKATAAGIGAATTTAASQLKKLVVPIVAITAASAYLGFSFSDQMQRIRTSAGASQAEVDRMTKAVLALAKTAEGGGQSPKKLAEGLYYVESSGIRGEKALRLLSAAAVNAGTTGADLTEIIKALTAAELIHIKGAEDETKAMGTLNAIVGAGKMTMDDLTAALSTGIGPAAKNVGITLPQLGAALDTMTKEGVPAQQAATKLTATFLRMLSPTTAAAKSLKKLGLSSDDLAQALQRGGLTDALGLLVKKYDATEKAQGKVYASQQLMAAFGRSRGGAAILSLVEGWGQYQKSLAEVNKTTGDYQRNSEAAMERPAYKAKVALASLESTLTEVGDQGLPVVAEAAQKLAAGLGKVVGAVGGWRQAFALILSGLVAVKVMETCAWFVKLSTVIRGVATASEAAAGAEGVGGLLGAVGTAGAAGGPIGLAIAGVAILSGGLAYLALKSGGASSEVDRLVASLKRLDTAESGLADAKAAVASDKLAKSEAELAIEQAKRALATSSAAKGSLEYKQLELNLAEAENQHSGAARQLARDQTALTKALFGGKVAAGDAAGEYGTLIGQAEKAGKSTRDLAKEFRDQAAALKDTNPVQAHNLQLLAQFTSSLKSIKQLTVAQWVKVISLVVNNKDATKKLSDFPALVRMATQKAASTAAGRPIKPKVDTSQAKGALDKLPGLVKSSGSAAAGQASLSGQAIARAMVIAISGTVLGSISTVAVAIESLVRQAVASAGAKTHGSGEYEFTRHEVGDKMVKGITDALHSGSGELSAALEKLLKDTVTRRDWSEDVGKLESIARAYANIISPSVRAQLRKQIQELEKELESVGDKDELNRIEKKLTKVSDAVKAALSISSSQKQENRLASSLATALENIVSPTLRAKLRKSVQDVQKELEDVGSKQEMAKIKKQISSLTKAVKDALSLNPVVKQLRSQAEVLAAELARLPASLASPMMAKLKQILKKLGDVTSKSAADSLKKQLQKLLDEYDAAIQKLSDQVDKSTTTAESAFGRLEDQTFEAFDAQTQQLLDAVDRQAQAQTDAIEQQAQAQIAAAEAAAAILTPGERRLQLIQGYQQTVSTGDALADAQAALEAAHKLRVGWDATELEKEKAIQDAERQLRDAQLQQQEDDAQTEADQERKAADDLLAIQEKSIEDQAALQEKAIQDAAELQKKGIEDQREQLRQSLQDRFDAIQAEFETGEPAAIAQAQSDLAALLADPEMQGLFADSGSLIGQCFAASFAAELTDVQQTLADLWLSAETLADATGSTPITYTPSGGGSYLTIPGYAGGGDVPGPRFVARRDTVLAKLTPGEGVLTPGVNQALKEYLAAGGGGDSGDTYNLTVNFAGPVLGSQKREICKELANEMASALNRRIAYNNRRA